VAVVPLLDVLVVTDILFVLLTRLLLLHVRNHAAAGIAQIVHVVIFLN